MREKLRWPFIFLFFSLGRADEVCERAYQEGFYDPCVDVNCKFYCPSSSNKRITVADPEDCQNYFLCHDGHLLPQRCPDGQRFNFNTHGCRTKSDYYDKCQPSCRDNQYKNFIVIPSSTQTTTATTFTNKQTDAAITTSWSTVNSLSETTRKSTRTESDLVSSAMLGLKSASTLSNSEEVSPVIYTDSCISLHPNTTDKDIIELQCIWTCGADDQIESPAEFHWYKDSLLMSNTSSQCSNYKDKNLEDNDDDNKPDDGAKLCFNIVVASDDLSSTLQISASGDYEGLYQCAVVSSDGREYASNVTTLVPPLVLNWSQKVDSDASVAVLSCGLRRSDGREASRRLCSDYFLWKDANDNVKKVSRCNQSVELNVDFRKNSTFTCEWTSSFGLKLSHIFFIPEVNDVCLAEVESGIFWNSSQVNSTLEKPCPGLRRAFARRLCILNDANKAEWTKTDFSECIKEEFLNIFYKLEAIEHQEMDYQLVSFLASNLSTLTETGNLVPQNLDVTIRCLKLLVDIRSDNARPSLVTDDEVESVMGIVSNILEKSNMESWNLLRKSDADIATAVMKTVDSYLVRIDRAEEVFRSNLAIKVSTPNYSDNVMKIQPLRRGSFESLDTTSFDNISMSLDFFKSQNHYHIPAGFPTQSPMVYTAIYTNLDELLPVQNNNSFLASRILVIKTSSHELPQIYAGMNITFSHTVQNLSRLASPSCVFWNFSLGQNGAWSEEGCRVLWTNENATTCSCDHMTNFAILMTIDQEALVDNAVIRTISLVGCIISIVSLCLTIIVLVFSWKKDKMSHHYAILINLCVALIIANVVFIAGIDKTQPRGACIAVATLLHLFFMAAFFLMLAEGIQLLLYVIHVFHVQRTFETVIIIASAWVLAGAVVGISLGVSGTEGYGTSKHCWLSSSQGLVWAFIGPALFIILINLCILFVVLYKASRKKVASEKQDIKSQIKRAMWNMLVISPLLGITWVFGVLSVSNSLDAFQYIFAVVNSLQGLFIFIFHGFCRQIRLKKSVPQKFSRSISSKGDQQKLRKVGQFKQDDPVYNLGAVCNDYHLPGHLFEAKNTAIFSDYQATDEDVGATFTAMCGSQSTESSYVESVSSH